MSFYQISNLSYVRFSNLNNEEQEPIIFCLCFVCSNAKVIFFARKN